MLYYDIKEFSKAIRPETRLLGIDVGEKTLGLAISDSSRTIATPFTTLFRKKFTVDVARLAEIAGAEGASGLVIGLPLNMDGTQGRSCQSVTQFARNTQKYIDLPILLWDERLSTVAVRRALQEASASRETTRKSVDKMAASFILQGVLDGMRG